MRYLCVLALLLTCLTVPLRAQAPSPPTPVQLGHQRDLLQRYGTRLLVWSQRYNLFQQVCDQQTPDQETAVHELRLTAAQRSSLLNLVRDNLAALDKEGLDPWMHRLGPKVKEIMGDEQFDVLLQLNPSPQQLDRIRDVFKAVSTTPEGILTQQAATELKASLSEDQRTWLDPFLTLATPSASASAAPSPAVPAPKPPALKSPKGVTGPRPERRLVMMRKNSVGDYYAEVSPSFDYTLTMPRCYRVEGADASVLDAVSSGVGLPVRLLGIYQDDLVNVTSASLAGPPAVQPIEGDYTVWRGRLPARVVSQSPPTVELDAGRGQLITAQLDFQNPNESRDFAKISSSGGKFLVGGTCLTRAGKATLVDLDFTPWQAPQAPFGARALIQLSDEFLTHAASEFLAGHQDKLSFKNATGQNGIQVSDVGATLQGCQASQLRVYGRVSASLGGLKVIEGELEVLTKLAFVKSQLQMTEVPGSLQVRLYYPLFAAVPASWIDTARHMFSLEYSQGVTVNVPGEYRADLVKTGLLEDSQIDAFQVFTLPSGDRRTSLVAIGAPLQGSAGAGAAPPPTDDALRTRIQAPGEFTLALSEEAINAALQKKIPGMLPMERPVPQEMQDLAKGIKLTAIIIPHLDLSFHNGLFQINDCEVDVAWHVGLFSGVEPGVRFKGTAQLIGSGDPMKLAANVKLQSLDFLSGRIADQTPEDQQELKDKMTKQLQEHPVDLFTPDPVNVKLISPRASLSLTGVAGTETPSELLLRGRLQP